MADAGDAVPPAGEETPSLTATAPVGTMPSAVDGPRLRFILFPRSDLLQMLREKPAFEAQLPARLEALAVRQLGERIGELVRRRWRAEPDFEVDDALAKIDGRDPAVWQEGRGSVAPALADGP